MLFQQIYIYFHFMLTFLNQPITTSILLLNTLPDNPDILVPQLPFSQIQQFLNMFISQEIHNRLLNSILLLIFILIHYFLLFVVPLAFIIHITDIVSPLNRIRIHSLTLILDHQIKSIRSLMFFLLLLFNKYFRLLPKRTCRLIIAHRIHRFEQIVQILLDLLSFPEIQTSILLLDINILLLLLLFRQQFILT